MIMTRSIPTGISALVCVIGCGVAAHAAETPQTRAETSPPVAAIVRYLKAHPDGTAAWSFDADAYRHSDLHSLPIGIFDSGVGGLTVLEAILSLDVFHNDTLKPGADGVPDFDGEWFVYLGDQANMPYGNYGSAGKESYLRELILKDAVFLLGRRYHRRGNDRSCFDKPPVKAIVIACNTATAAGLEDVRMLLNAYHLPIPLVGVVEAGARGVLDATRNQSDPSTVAVLATVGTCRTGAYPRLIGRTLGLAGRPVPSIIQHGSARLAGAIEGDPAFTESVDELAYQDVRALADQQLQAGNQKNAPIRTVVLGCTHFPLAKAEIDSAFDRLRLWRNEQGNTPYANVIAQRRVYVDPAEWTARELFLALSRTRLRQRDAGTGVNGDWFFLSVPDPASPGIELDATGGLKTDYKYGRSPGEWDVEDTRRVALHPETLAPTTLSMIRKRLPNVWKRMRNAVR